MRYVLAVLCVMIATPTLAEDLKIGDASHDLTLMANACLTTAEGNLATRALDMLVRQQGLTVDSANAVALAQKLAGMVSRCEAAASAAHDAAVAAKAKAVVEPKTDPVR